MRTKKFSALLLKIATLFSISFIICLDHKDHFPIHQPIIPHPEDDPAVIQSECESDCARSGKHTLCGTDHCTYSGYIELQCVQKCGRPVTKWTEVKCTKDTPPPPNGWVKVTECANTNIQ